MSSRRTERRSLNRLAGKFFAQIAATRGGNPVAIAHEARGLARCAETRRKINNEDRLRRRTKITSRRRKVAAAVLDEV